jgi:glycerophosphoryl diester phosphodiesterase
MKISKCRCPVRTRAPAQLASMAPLISAHRGSCGTPGLGLAESYRRAIDLGVDFVEFDIRRTADRAYVVSHDPFLAGGERISTLTFDEYRRAAGDQTLTVAELLELAGGRVGRTRTSRRPATRRAPLTSCWAAPSRTGWWSRPAWTPRCVA